MWVSLNLQTISHLLYQQVLEFHYEGKLYVIGAFKF